MADVGDNNFIRHVYRGEEGEIIPREATHIIVGEDVTFVRARAFYEHPNIVEVICHDKVEKIERFAFAYCPNLRRVIMPGVKIVEGCAFEDCEALVDVECGKLEIIKHQAFGNCTSLRGIHLPSARIVWEEAFFFCADLTNVKFGSKLERIDREAFLECYSLERITIPLKDGLIPDDTDNIFMLCEKLHQVDLIEGELLATIAALQLEEWRNDMNREIDSINQILTNASAGEFAGEYGGQIIDEDVGEKTQAIRRWIRSILGKIIHYQAEHQRILNEEVAPTLQLVLPRDIAFNYVLPFLELPSHTFGVQEE